MSMELAADGLPTAVAGGTFARQGVHRKTAPVTRSPPEPPMSPSRVPFPEMHRRARSALAAAVGLVAGAACTDAEAGRRSARREVPVASAEWERDLERHVRHPVQPIALRAGSGLVALLHDPPLGYRIFAMRDQGRGAAGGPQIGRPAPPGFWGLGRPSDVVGLHADSAGAPADAWFLDPARGRVIGTNVGAARRTVAGLGTRGTVRTACTLGARAIAYLDEARPDTVLVRALHAPYAVRPYPFPRGLLVGRGGAWTDLRFGGSQDGPCVIHAPRMRGVAVVTDTAVHAVAPFVEPLSRVDSLYAAGAWYARAVDLLSRDEPRTGAIDATSWHGGAAVLFEGRTPDAGRVVDFYDARGAYVTSLRLPHRALRIAATRHRLVVLRQSHGRVFLASYVLPAEIRTGAVEDEPELVAPDGAEVFGGREPQEAP